MKLITKENGYESLKKMKPGEIFYLKLGESEIGSALSLALNGIVTLENLFRINIQKTDVNAEIIDKLVEDYKTYVSIEFAALHKMVAENLGEEAYIYFDRNRAHYDVKCHTAANLLSIERKFCPGCDTK